MKFQTGPQGWSNGATFVAPGAIVDDAGIPCGPLDGCALDLEAAVTAYATYRHCRHRLHRKLHWSQEALYQEIIQDPRLLRLWISKAEPQQPTIPKFDLATALDAAIQRKQTNPSASGRG